MIDRELRLVWWCTGGAVLVGLAGYGLVWALWMALHHYTHQVIAGVLLMAFMGFLGWGLSGISMSVKPREWDE